MPPLRVRREGFTGQHLVVVPSPVVTRASRHPLLKSLLVTDAGYFPSARGHRVERPQGSWTHLVILCLEGEGWASSHGKTFQVRSGEIIWLPANSPHSYGSAEANPWRILWVHFSGDEVPAWQQELGWAAKFPLGQFHFGPERLTSLGLENVYGILESGYSIQHLLKASTALRSVFCAALIPMQSAGTAKTKTAEERTASAREKISADPSRQYRLEELAALAGLSVPHFSVLFRRQTGYAPIDFLIRQRIRNACRLLDMTQAKVASIAAETGFQDPYYFSRCFHRIMGQSPRAYRNRIKG